MKEARSVLSNAIDDPLRSGLGHTTIRTILDGRLERQENPDEQK
jgi:hypothetical protein